MKGVDTIARIRREFFVRGKTIKQIARELHIARNTVRKVLRSGATEFHYERERQPLPRIGPWREDQVQPRSAKIRASRSIQAIEARQATSCSCLRSSVSDCSR